MKMWKYKKNDNWFVHWFFAIFCYSFWAIATIWIIVVHISFANYNQCWQILNGDIEVITMDDLPASLTVMSNVSITKFTSKK